MYTCHVSFDIIICMREVMVRQVGVIAVSNSHSVARVQVCARAYACMCILCAGHVHIFRNLSQVCLCASVRPNRFLNVTVGSSAK